jgi:uncharacterized protein with PIN domain
MVKAKSHLSEQVRRMMAHLDEEVSQFGYQVVPMHPAELEGISEIIPKTVNGRVKRRPRKTEPIITCTKCGRSFRMAAHLARHMKSHKKSR